MSTQNYYEVLGLKQSCSRKDIKKKYRDLALIHHPDKGGSEETFEKITLAYTTLVNKEEREKYNEMINNNVYESHFILKKKCEKFINNTDNIVNNREDDEEKNNFLQFTDINRNIPTKLNKTELTQRINELELAREQEDIEIIQDSLFNNNKFDDEIFNANFIISNTKDEIIKQQKPKQYNVDNYKDSSKDIFGFDLNNKLKKYDNSNKNYKIAKNASKKKIDKIKNSLNIHSHNVLEQNYSEHMEDLLKNRESETIYLNNLKRTDYNKNDKSYIISKNE